MRRAIVASATAIVLALVALTVTIALQDDGPAARPLAAGYGGMSSMMRGASEDSDRGSGADMGSLMQESRVDSEADFLTMMVAHHEEAIMAAQELARSDRPEMRALGESIVASQSAQVEDMSSWLEAWYPEAPAADYQPMMRDLSQLSGDELDRAFLRDMVVHHMMAVMMSQQLLVRGLAEHPEVAALARTIRHDQRAEIVRMMRWSRAWFGTGWPHGYGHGAGHGSGMGMMR